ncbi:hypothetical protein [Anaerotruncus colihominis]|nr:hypothetical protein [Anaerotruncus colihominis]
MIKMRLPAERADAQKNSCKATIFYRLLSAIYKKLAIRAVPGAGPFD